MDQLKLFIELTRLKKPIGYMLLFWPCIWGLTIVYDFNSSLFKYFFYACLFLGGSILMRSAGCIVNDIVDKNFDKILLQLGWLTGLATIMPVGSAGRLAKRLRLSRVEDRCLARLDVGINDDELAMLNGPKWQQGAYYLGDWAPMLYAVQSWRNLTTVDTRRCDELAAWMPPKIPICGTDLLSHGVDNGLTIGHMLSVAERQWVASDFTLKKTALLEWLLNELGGSHDVFNGKPN